MQSCQASAVSSSGATLSASIDPNGSRAMYHFDYGTSTAYGNSTSEQPVGSDSHEHQVSATASGLRPGTVYHCRAVASNAAGTTYGADQQFSTAAAGVALAPTVQSSCQASAVTRSAATLSASVDPHGQATSAYFQYGTGTSYGSQTAGQSLGSDSQEHQLAAALRGLAPHRTYHCRAVATNATGTTYGADQTFRTMPGGGHHSRSPARLRLGSIAARAARQGCNVEYSRVARAAQLTDHDCTKAILTLAGRIDRRADGQRLTTRLHGLIGGRVVLIVAQARVTGGRWRLAVKLPGRRYERRDAWRFEIGYAGDGQLRQATVTGGFRLEIEPPHPATGGPYP